MKTITYLIICMCLASCVQPKSSDETTISDTTVVKDKATMPAEPEKQQIPRSVTAIKAAYNTTVQQLQNNQLDSISYKYNCQGERSGTVTYFSHQGEVKMVKHQYNEYDHFSATDQYFMVDQKLFFAHLNRLTWSFESNGTAEGATKDDIVEQRVYVVDDAAIECLEKKYTIRSKANNNPNPAAIANRKVACQPIAPVLKDFNRLLDFQKQATHDCLTK